MKYLLTLLLVTLASYALADSVQMWQPSAILSTVPTLHITAVTLGEEETVIVLHPRGLLTGVPETAYLSDEADRHYPLLRAEPTDTTLTLIFKALPQDTRLLDVMLDDSRRWMGVHSGIRNLRLPAAHPQFDADATLPDSTAAIVQASTLEDILADDSIYAAVKRQLPLFRDYVVWKWKLTPHAAYLLHRAHEHLALMRQASPGVASLADPSPPPRDSAANAPFRKQLPHGPKPRQPNLLQRLFGRKTKAAPANSHPRPISRFEQKMLQEMRK
jgi:hypothetical protein